MHGMGRCVKTEAAQAQMAPAAVMGHVTVQPLCAPATLDGRETAATSQCALAHLSARVSFSQIEDELI
jgi:hypothetical protein